MALPHAYIVTLDGCPCEYHPFEDRRDFAEARKKAWHTALGLTERGRVTIELTKTEVIFDSEMED